MRRIFMATVMLGLMAPAVRADFVATIGGTTTYYDGSDGALAQAFAIPTGATQALFRVTGGVVTGSGLAVDSADGLNSSGNPPYNFTNTRFSGTYQGTKIGGTTGIDPALFGIFFNPNFGGTPADSLNYRSDSGITPDLRAMLSYSPSQNQPFYIGDGYNQNNSYATSSDMLIPAGVQQIFNIPTGAQSLLFGMGADPALSDNSGSYTVHVTFLPAFASVPEPSSVVLMGIGTLTPLACRWRRGMVKRKAKQTPSY